MPKSADKRDLSKKVSKVVCFDNCFRMHCFWSGNETSKSARGRVLREITAMHAHVRRRPQRPLSILWSITDPILVTFGQI